MTYTNQYDSSRWPPAPVIEMVVGNPGKSPSPVMLKAIVDSGADHTVIPLEVVERLDLPYRDKVDVKDFSENIRKVPIYSARVSIPTLNKEHPVLVIGIDKGDALAGRDILNHYKVTLDGLQKKIEIE